MKAIRVQINAVDDEGRGRGTHTDAHGREFDVAVRGAFPGDDVLVALERTFAAHQLLVGKATQFFNRGYCHIKRVCPHSAPCPACPLHGVDVALALEIKRGRIEQALTDADLKKIPLPPFSKGESSLQLLVDDIVRHPSELGYRQKVKLMAHVEKNRLQLGVYVPYSHSFVVAEQCPHVNPSINAAIERLLALLNSLNVSADLSAFKAVILRATKNGVAAVVVVKRALSDEVFAALTAAVTQEILVCVVEIQTAETNSILAGNLGRQIGSTLVEPLEGGPAVDPDSFCQSDPAQATRMYDLVAEFLTNDGTEGCFLDAYAGVGGFTRALQRRGVREIIAVEQSPSALSALQHLGVHVVLTPMSEALARLAQNKPFAGIVVDPPKKGLMDDAQAIATLGAKKLVLVSCDPDAMAKDLKILIAHGYSVERILPMDFFAGTPAIETLVFLTLV